MGHAVSTLQPFTCGECELELRLSPGPDKKREFFGVKKEWVVPFDLIPIIDVEIDGEVRSMAAQYMCEKLGVQSINDRVKLAEAHDTCCWALFASCK